MRKINLSILFFLFIILFAIYFRLASIDLAEFKGDEARDSFIAKDLVEKGKVPLLGAPTMIGGNSGPIYYFLLALPFSLSANPIVASAFIASLNVIAVVVTYKFARDFFNERIALIASALTAVSPFVIIFSRKIWNPDLIFPFSIILLYSVYSVVLKKNAKFLIPLFVSLSFLVQIHAITLFLVPALLIFLFKFRSNIKLKYLAVGLLLSVFLFSPFIYFELTNNFKNTRILFSTSSLYQFNKLNMISISHLAGLTSGSGFNYMIGNEANSFNSSIFNINRFFVVENFLLFFGTILLFYFSTRKTFSDNLKYSILLFWFLIPLVILLFFNGPLQPYHLLLLLPVNFLIIAILFDFLLEKAERMRFQKQVKFLILFVLVAILIAQIVFDQAFLDFLNKNGGTDGMYEIGVKYKLDVARFVTENSPQNFSISYNLQPNDIGLEYKYLLSLYNKTPSSTPSVQYIVSNKLSIRLSSTELQSLSKYQNVNFGPLTVYIVR
jgi:4-amino-4-deoxy-L-arabinose transferase-like glycosyltransferase